MSGPKHLESEAPANEHQFVRITPDSSEPGERLLANEVPAAIEFDGTPYAVMMLSPTDLKISLLALRFPNKSSLRLPTLLASTYVTVRAAPVSTSVWKKNIRNG